MSTTAIATTNTYRQRIAQAAAAGGALSPIARIAFGSGQRPYSLDDTALQAQFAQVAATVTRAGVLVTATAVLTGAQAGSNALREVGVYTADGTLVARRVVAPKEFEPEMQIEYEITFQY